MTRILPLLLALALAIGAVAGAAFWLLRPREARDLSAARSTAPAMPLCQVESRPEDLPDLPRGVREPGEEGSTAGSWRAVAEGVPPGADLRLTLAPPIGVRGTVVDDLGRPVEEFTLRLVERRRREAGSGNDAERKRTCEDAEGRFEVEDLAPGTWTVTADAEGHAPSEPAEITLPGHAGPIALTVPRASSIGGIVFDPTGAPAAGARVQVQVQRDRRGGGRSATAVADERGHFALEQLDPGAARVSATHEDWAPAPAEPVNLAPGQHVAGLLLSLSRGGRLTGEVFDADGAPDAGRQIMVQAVGRSGRSGGSARADDAGWFELDRLAPGSYQVVAFPELDQIEEGDQTAILQSMRMTTAEIVEAETTHVLLGAPPADPVRLFGRVSQGGEPLAGVMVMALAEGGAMLAKMKVAETGPDGEYEVTLDEPGDYMLMVGQRMGDDQGCEFHETIPAGAEHRLDLELPGGRIAGRVLGPDGAPVEGVRVTYERERGGLSIFSLGGMRTAETDPDGRYELVDLRPGVYAVRAGSLSSSGGPRRYGVALRSGVSVGEGLTGGVDLELSPPGTIAGEVLDAAGRRAVGASIFLRGADGRLLNPFSTTETDGRGGFRFDGCAPGSYTVSARLDLLASPESAPVQVVEGEDAAVDLVLGPAAVLRISVEDGEGAAVRATVRVFDGAGREVGSMLGSEAMEVLFSEGFSSTEQRVGPVPPGSYRVEATAPSGETARKSVSLHGQEQRRVRLRLR